MKNKPQGSILVIDDDRGPRESLRILLGKYYRVHCAADVKSGIDILREHSPDLVIMDIRMPEIDGIEGLRMIREIDPLVAVVMLTGFGALETAQEALRLGADDYIKKPFEIKEFRCLVEEHLDRSMIRRRRAESERELRELNRKLTEELTEREHMASLGQASAELVHDLRNPMAVVYGYVQLLSSGLRQALDKGSSPAPFVDTLEYIDVVEKNVERCNSLIEVWQNLSKKDPNRVTTFAVPAMLRELAQSLRETALSRRVRVEIADTEDNGHVLGDYTQLSRVFHNLIVNALDAVAEDGSGLVRLTCKNIAGEIVTTVEDNGCGIPPDIRKKILDAYYSTKAAHKGTGLGLFIAKKIIDDHHGRLQVDSTVGAGSRFSVTLPAWDNVCQAS